MLALFLGGLAIVGGLEWLHTCQARLAHLTTDGHVAAFDLDGEGSLAVWFSTATLELAALTTLLAWAIRRQTPGSRGQNVLPIAAACWLVMSIDECASVHEAFKELMAHSTGHRLLGDGTIWWVMGYGLVLSAVGMCLLWEFRRSWDSTAWLLATAAVYALAVVTEMELIIPNKGQTSVMLEEGCEMVGNVCLLLSMVCHARWAVRGAERADAANFSGAPALRRQAA